MSKLCIGPVSFLSLHIFASLDAVELANTRLGEMIISESNLLNKVAYDYLEKTEKEMVILNNLNDFPVQRSTGIDGFLKDHYNRMSVPVKIQSEYDTIQDAIEKLEMASLGKKYAMKIVIQTKESESCRLFDFQTDVEIIKSLKLQAKKLLKKSLGINADQLIKS